ncbi:MAG: DoxX family protein [Candidatus Marinimicrobia bacterium]|nr:DoxX family protein [Candidatus Neomarinimicrobiota bacterium]
MNKFENFHLLNIKRLFLGIYSYRDMGLLILRIGIGIMFILHGYPKIMGGPYDWAKLGMNGMGSVGIQSFHAFWGFMAAISEFVGGILLALGFLFRPVLILLLLTMVFAALSHITTGKGSPYHAIESGILFFSLMLIGPGRYSLDRIIFKN